MIIVSENVFFNEIDEKVTDSKSLGTFLILPLILTLIFIQALRAYVPGIYIAIFHVVFQDPGWISSLLILFTIALFFIPCFTNLLCKKTSPKAVAKISIIVMVLLRLLMAIPLPSLLFESISPGFPATYETILSALIIMCYGMYMGAFLGNWIENDSKISAKSKMNFFSVAMIGAFLLDAVLRTFGLTLDPTLLTMPLIPSYWFVFQYLGVIIILPLAIIAIFITMKWFGAPFEKQEVSPDDAGSGISKSLVIIVSFSLAFFLFLETNVLLYPNAIAQFTGTHYALINPIMIVGIAVSLLILLFCSDKILLNKGFIVVINVLLVIFLAQFLFVEFLIPLAGTLIMYMAAIFIALAQVFFFLDLYLVLQFLGRYKFRWNRIKSISNGIAFNLGIMILFDFLYDFTTDHAFTISAFRGLGPLLLLVGGIILVVLTILLSFLIKEDDSK